MPANVLATSTKCHACYADEKVFDVLHLSCKTTFQTSKCPESGAPATQNRHSSKNENKKTSKTSPSEERPQGTPFRARIPSKTEDEGTFVLKNGYRKKNDIPTSSINWSRTLYSSHKTSLQFKTACRQTIGPLELVGTIQLAAGLWILLHNFSFGFLNFVLSQPDPFHVCDDMSPKQLIGC